MKLYDDSITNVITTTMYSTNYDCTNSNAQTCVYNDIQGHYGNICCEHATKHSYSEEDKSKIQDEIKSDYVWQGENYYTDYCETVQINPEPIKMGNELEFDLSFEFTNKSNKAALPCLNNLNAKYFHKRLDRGKITFPFKSTVLFRNSRFEGFLSMLDEVRLYFSKNPSGSKEILKHNGKLLFTLEELFDVLKNGGYTIE